MDNAYLCAEEEQKTGKKILKAPSRKSSIVGGAIGKRVRFDDRSISIRKYSTT
jgi:hypothetical protein